MSRKFFGTDGVRGRANSGAMTADMVLRIGLPPEISTSAATTATTAW